MIMKISARPQTLIDLLFVCMFVCFRPIDHNSRASFTKLYPQAHVSTMPIRKWLVWGVGQSSNKI